MMDDRKEILMKEIDLIQGCINRMAQNSFVIKGWTITLIAVVLALLPETVDLQVLSGVGVIATLCFWYLDAFFLRTERLYRWKYEWVIKNRKVSAEHCYDLNPDNEKMWMPDKYGNARVKPPIIRIMITKTLTPVYLPLLILSIVAMVIEQT